MDRSGQSRGNMPKGFTVRKVRASQSRITDNVRPGRPAGKCNRNKPPQLLYSTQNLDLEISYVERSDVRSKNGDKICALYSNCGKDGKAR